jgi:CBS domain-containing protein
MATVARDLTTFPRSVVWSRGPGCAELAEVLATGDAHQVDANPAQACIDRRADLAVMRSLGSFDLVPVVVPSGLDLSAVEKVVAAISTGPHSDLAAVIAARMAASLAVPARALTAVRPGAPRAAARSRLIEVRAVSGLEGDVVEAADAAGVVSELADGTLIVLGAPGGSWLTRQFFGPGAKLRGEAPAGTVVVRDAPTRVFQHLVDATWIGVHTRVEDALRVTVTSTVPVAEEGRLLGIVRRSTIEQAAAGREVGDVLEEPPLVFADEELDSLQGLVDFYGDGPIPVVDSRGTLLGVLPAAPI